MTARTLRTAHPEQSLLIGARDVARANEVAAELGNAEGVAVDLARDDLGLGDRSIRAVGLFVKDESMKALRYAQRRGVPFTSISTYLFDLATEVAAYMHNPRSTVVLASEWLAGSTVLTALYCARDYDKLDRVHVVTVLDEQDLGGTRGGGGRPGPAFPSALTMKDGVYQWVSGDDRARRVTCADGSEMDASAYSPLDVVALAEATGAPNISFDFAVGESCGRRNGGSPSAEVLVDLSGVDRQGNPKSSRHALVSSTGQAPVTALGLTLILERVTGLDGQPAAGSGLLFAEHIITPDAFMKRALAEGFTFTDL